MVWAHNSDLPDLSQTRKKGFETPKPPEMPTKIGKTSQPHNWPRYMDSPQIGPKIAIKQVKKDKWYLFRAPTRARKKPININIFGRTVSGTNRNRPWDKWDPSPGQNGTRPWDKPAFLCLIPQSNRHFVPFVPGTGGGSSLGRLSHKGRQKNVCVFSVYWFFCSQLRQQLLSGIARPPVKTRSFVTGALVPPLGCFRAPWVRGNGAAT